MQSKQTKQSKQSLRKLIHEKRHNLAVSWQRKTARELRQKMLKVDFFKKSQRIAFYWPAHGEIDPRPLLHEALKMGKRCYLPALSPCKEKHLLFVEYRLGDTLKLNRYGIEEPILNHKLPLMPWMLNLIFVPLVAFDLKGRRLGRGGGYYDQSFAFIKNKTQAKVKVRNPKLIGLAYEFQKIDNLPYEDEEWDLKLDGVCTEKGYLDFSS